MIPPLVISYQIKIIFVSLIIAAHDANFGTNKPAFAFLAVFGIIALITMFWMDKKEGRN